jgi:hypothetical protein
MATKTKTRGFRSLYGKTIRSINTKAINVVTITCSDGSQYEITGEPWFNGIPALECAKVHSGYKRT